MEQLMFIHRVSKVLDCSRPMVYKLIYEGKIKAVRIGKRGLRISKPSLEQFIEENTIDPLKFAISEEYDNHLQEGDTVVIPLDSEEYNELAGCKMEVVSTNRKGVYAKEEGEPGAGVFIPNGYYNIPRDSNLSIHGGM